jgi:hypothetical protein
VSQPPAALLQIEERWQHSVDKASGPAGGPYSATSWATILGYGEWGERAELTASHDLWGSVPLEEYEERDGRIPGGHQLDNVIFVWDDGRVVDHAAAVSLIDVVPPPTPPTVTHISREWGGFGKSTAVTSAPQQQRPTRVLRHHGETVSQAYVRYRADPPTWIAWEEMRDFWDDPGLSPSVVASCRILDAPREVDRRCLSVTGRYSPYPTRGTPTLVVMS